MKTKIITLLLTTVLTASMISGCGNTAVEDSVTETATVESAENTTDAKEPAADSTIAESTTAEDAGSDAVMNYENDSNLFMQVKSFDESSFTGDLCREEKITQEDVDSAQTGSDLYSINGTQFTVVSFEDVNKEIEYDTDEVFKNDVVGSTRFDGFLVKCADDGFSYALQKEESESEYLVVPLFEEGVLRKTVEENVTFSIKENCEICLQKFVEKDGITNLETETITGREFKGDNYPGWSEGATEYYLTSDMLMAISVTDGALDKAIQVYIP